MTGRLFPLQIVRTEPAHYGTADCTERGLGDDGMTYILKRAKAGAHIPLSEYLCTRLAEAIGLAVPPCAIAELPALPDEPVERCFATREEGAAENAARYLVELLASKRLSIHAPVLSQWFAYDTFVQNVDRHANNFLLRKTTMGDAIVGIDFSRAWMTQGWPPAPPPLPQCNTVTVQRALAANTPYPPRQALQAIDRLAAMPDEWVNMCLAVVPSEWADARLRAHIHRWWRQRRPKRLNLLRRHFANGRYLRLCADSRGP